MLDSATPNLGATAHSVTRDRSSPRNAVPSVNTTDSCASSCAMPGPSRGPVTITRRPGSSATTNTGVKEVGGGGNDAAVGVGPPCNAAANPLISRLITIGHRGLGDVVGTTYQSVLSNAQRSSPRICPTGRRVYLRSFVRKDPCRRGLRAESGVTQDDADLHPHPDAPTPTATPSQRRSVATRQALLRAGGAQFAAAGYSGASLREIVERSGVTKGAVYFHFSGKPALAEAVIAETIAIWERMEIEVEARGMDPLRTLIAQTDRVAALMTDDPVVRGGTRLLNDPLLPTRWADVHYGFAEDSARTQLVAAAAGPGVRALDQLLQVGEEVGPDLLVALALFGIVADHEPLGAGAVVAVAVPVARRSSCTCRRRSR